MKKLTSVLIIILIPVLSLIAMEDQQENIDHRHGICLQDIYKKHPGLFVTTYNYLRILDLSDQKLTCFQGVATIIPDDGDLRLYLENNELETLPTELSKLRIITLNLEGNLFEHIPLAVCSLEYLQQLHMSNNNILSIPSQIQYLENISTLILNNNSIEEISPAIGSLERLVHLDLGNNFIEKLPREIGLLKTLMVLKLAHNEITKLPPEIGDLTSLQELDVSHNNLKTLPKQLGDLTRLTSLDITNNPNLNIIREAKQKKKLAKALKYSKD